MKRKKNKWRIIIGYASFFILIAAIVTVAVIVYSSISAFNDRVVAGIMLGVVIFLAALCTAVDVLRRKFTVTAPVDRILEATERIARGDFSVRLEIKHRINDYDEFDYIAENLNKMAAELDKNEVLKSDFISNISHEIKTPLAVIRNYAAAIKSDRLSEDERQKYANTLVEASERLTGLTVNILKLNKLENQQIKPEYQTVRLDELLANCVISFEEAIDKKGIVLNCDMAEISLVTSPAYLEIVWNNLLSNAVKFTPYGGTISVELKEEDGKAVVTVADTGCGISPEAGARIFDKFYQGDTSHSAEGNGLGLALVKKVIDILGGEISVVSEPGKGSVFTVRLKK
ncbi:MAG: HAMP domain-containing histidine kinase [Clostridia bacterium]|nr:HAMP domain-containing histidine kinase [Clostridia bacterium]